ncbi:Aldo/keto reductase [Leptospira biflexa serovar Patoc strain 'Patoc 1 (Ames)']|uniref:2,5-diketo-D-gluconic acid reductase A n=1 Tax=Leptospira biflexa serovar Patoc (strain Patoc 1 / ATCC 23582 / Paris) TaxID=456481 RepID=B0SLF1_LEPBP|nr:aldo/keto reductase [Leptospira biflexa]ABZ94866.1 Aldo/keto reductase [Leptospira biflexa serovar Patoc strain 'Patoc 1 (Ames)']ABZ98537.1 2,5-diketo-D-gluconic acid reductase A [Leptospira biflexa serovar Patoc strain 'Patoc 1 (Paris)']
MSELNLTSTIPTNQSIDVPLLGLGVWKSRPKECYDAVKSALEFGYRHIDTAAIYGNEADVGRALKESGIKRSDIFLVTKLWNADQGYDEAQKAIDISLKKLGTDYVDMYLIHFPVSGKRNDSWRALEKIKGEGKARSIGVSNFMVPHLEELLKETDIIPAMNQVEYHPFLQDLELKEYCIKKGIVLEAYSPLAHGQKLEDERITNLAKKYHKSNAQILIRWSLQNGNVVIPKSKNPIRIKENADVFDFVLSPDDMKEIHSWNENFRTCWDPTTVD